MSAGETRERHDQLLQELAAERVAALTRIARTLENLLTELRTLRTHVVGLDAAARRRELDKYRELRARALEYRWYLDVQREAMGLRHTPLLDEFYAVPGPIEA